MKLTVRTIRPFRPTIPQHSPKPIGRALVLGEFAKSAAFRYDLGYCVKRLPRHVSLCYAVATYTVGLWCALVCTHVHDTNRRPVRPQHDMCQRCCIVPIPSYLYTKSLSYPLNQSSSQKKMSSPLAVAFFVFSLPSPVFMRTSSLRKIQMTQKNDVTNLHGSSDRGNCQCGESKFTVSRPMRRLKAKVPRYRHSHEHLAYAHLGIWASGPNAPGRESTSTTIHQHHNYHQPTSTKHVLSTDSR